MKHIYLIVESQSETLGHGHYGEMYKLATYCIDTVNDKLCPAFKSEKAAQEYWKEKQRKFWMNCRPEISINKINNIISKLKIRTLKLPINNTE